MRRMSQLQRGLAKIRLAFWASKCGSLFQVPIRIVVLLAESRASNRVMTSGARTVPLSPAAATKGCLATQHQNVAAPAGCESSSGFQEPGYSQTNRTHTFWSSVVSVSCSIVLFVSASRREKFLARANVSHSCGPVSGYKLPRTCRCRRPRRPPRFIQRFRFAFPTGSRQVSEEAVTDPVLRAEPTTISFAQDDVGLPT